MSKEYHHPKVPEVLEAYKLLLNDSMALDYCGITGKERKLILNDPEFVREARKIKAEKYYEEITDVNNLIKSLKALFPGATVHGHNEFAAKACPSFDVKKWQKEVDL